MDLLDPVSISKAATPDIETCHDTMQCIIDTYMMINRLDLHSYKLCWIMDNLMHFFYFGWYGVYHSWSSHSQWEVSAWALDQWKDREACVSIKVTPGPAASMWGVWPIRGRIYPALANGGSALQITALQRSHHSGHKGWRGEEMHYLLLLL